MTKTQLKQFRNALHARKEELGRELRLCRGSFEFESSGDRMDQVRSMVERSAHVEDASRLSKELSLVEDACRRLDAGSFGMCQACGSDLPRKRLEVLPWTPYCVACQQLAERAHREIMSGGRLFPETLAS